MKAPLHYLVLKVSLLVFLIRPEVSLSNSYITDIGDLGGPSLLTLSLVETGGALLVLHIHLYRMIQEEHFYGVK